MKKFSYFLIALVVIATAIYALLGGFKSIEKSVEQDVLVHIAGYEYVGKIGSDSLERLFMQSKALVETEEAADAVAIVYYGEADPKTGAVHNFIGVLINEAPIYKMPKNWEIKTFERSQSVKGCIEANVLAMPTPDNMLAELRTYAQEQNMETDSIFVEYYTGPNQLCVELLGK